MRLAPTLADVDLIETLNCTTRLSYILMLSHHSNLHNRIFPGYLVCIAFSTRNEIGANEMSPITTKIREKGHIKMQVT